MREDFLHFIWKYKKLELIGLSTTAHEPIEILQTGSHNQLAGPDFFNSKLKINNQLWAGNVEIHLKSSDWYVHGHEVDANYKNVILHIVWEHDVEIFRKDNTMIPTLELKNYIKPELLISYNTLFQNKANSFINCEKQIASIDTFIFKNWLDRLYFERLETKSEMVIQLSEKYKQDWEQILFTMLLRNFGSKINGDSFLSIAHQLQFSVVRKLSSENLQLESVLFGLAGLLNDEQIEPYPKNLRKEYDYLVHKYSLNNHGVLKPDFFKLRPPNFPTIRLSQFADLYSKNNSLFSKIIAAKTIEDLYVIFDCTASVYWNTHFTFGKENKKSPKKLTKKFIDLIIMNTILPIRFNYAKYLGKTDESISTIALKITSEQNSIIEKFKQSGIKVSNAMESQSILQLYNEYCSKNKCLECAVGNSLLKDNT